MTNFEYLKTLDLENFSKELSEHFTSIDELKPWLVMYTVNK